MAPPAWILLSAATGEKACLDFAVEHWWKTSDFLFDHDEHLYFRDSSYFERREANGEKVFWSRGNGWVIAGLVRVLQYLPAGHPARSRFLQQYRAMADKILACQQSDGLWRSQSARSRGLSAQGNERLRIPLLCARVGYQPGSAGSR